LKTEQKFNINLKNQLGHLRSSNNSLNPLKLSYDGTTDLLTLSNEGHGLSNTASTSSGHTQVWSKSFQVLQAMVNHLNQKNFELSRFSKHAGTALELPAEIETFPVQQAFQVRIPPIKKKKRNGIQKFKRSRFELETSHILTSWLLAHKKNPYPTQQQKQQLAVETNLDVSQVQNWFINIRKRHLAPLRTGKRKPRSFLDFVLCADKAQTADEQFLLEESSVRGLMSECTLRWDRSQDIDSGLKGGCNTTIKIEAEHSHHAHLNLNEAESNSLLELEQFLQPSLSPHAGFLWQLL